MATNENLIPIPGRLHSVASDEIVSGANEIYDDKLSDNLENLNTGFTNDIDTIYNTIGDNNEKGAIMEQLNTIDGRLDTIDGEISALNHIPIEVVQLNPSTGEPNVSNPEGNILYRASNSDHTLYSDWMYKEDDHEWVMIFEQQTPSELEKLVGYYTCNTLANLSEKSIGDTGYVLPTNGGAMKIKMTNANTVDNATLRIGNETAKPLWYNDERASSSNTWDEGEVISVYYDGENYKASNAMGGGSAVGKKRLKGSTGYVNLTGETAPNPTTSGGSSAQYKYIQYPVKEGDVVEIKGKGNGSAWTWALIDTTNNRKIVESSKGVADYTNVPFVKVVPSGVDMIIINNHITGYADYEWYYAKAGSIGAHEILTEAYLYEDLKTLTLGQIYEENEAVKTSDKQLLRVTKEVNTMNITDAIAVGDLKTYGTGANASTYKALKNVNIYDGTETEGLYAIGRPSLVTITVDSSSLAIEEDTDISVTIGGVTNTITVTAAASETKDADIAALISTAFTNIEGWVLTNNNNGTLSLKCAIAGNNTISISSDTGETGLSITSATVGGNTSLSQYNDGSWEDISLATFAGDYADIGVTDNTKMWQKLSINDLISLNTVQNTLVKTSKAESISYNNSQSGLISNTVQEALDETSDILYKEISISYGSLITGNIIAAGGAWTANNDTHSFYAIPVTEGDKYRIVSNANSTTFFAYLYNLTRQATGPVSYAAGESNRRSIAANKTVVITIPAGTNYLYICNTNLGSSQLPQSIKKLKTIDITLSEALEDINSIHSDLKYYENIAFSNFGNLVTGHIIVASGAWSGENDGHSFYYRKVNEGEVYNMKSNATTTSYYAWLNSVSVDSPPDYTSGYSGRIGIAKDREIELTAPEGARYLYICNTNTGSSQLPQRIKRVYSVKEIALSAKDDIADMFETVHSKETIPVSSISTRRLIITQSGAWSGLDGQHKLISIGDFVGFKITANNSKETYYTYLKDDYCASTQMPHYAEGEIGRRRIGPGVSAFTAPIPSDAAYLYIQISSQYGTYTPSAIYGYKKLSNAVTSNSERISVLEGNNQLTLAYNGGKIDLKTYHYDVTRWYTNFAYAHQSGACFGDYYFMIKDAYEEMRVVNLATGTILYTGSTGVTGKTAARFHCNQCTFGTIYYDESDPFPLLYITVNEDSAFETRCSQEVYRVVATYDNETEEYTSFTLVQVQLIWLPTMTAQNSLGNANMVIDKVRNRMVFYSRYDGTPTVPVTNQWCKISEFNIPSFTPVEGDEIQVVILEDSNILNSYFIDSRASNMQGGCIYAGKLFIARGSYSVGYIELIVVDLMKKCQIALLEPYKDGILSSEPEGCFAYNGQVCISTLTSGATLNNGYFYKFTFE